jgi:hypothetical protein
MTDIQVFGLLIWIAGIVLTPVIAKNKGKDPGVWFLVGIVFGVLGMFAAMLGKPADQARG